MTIKLGDRAVTRAALPTTWGTLDAIPTTMTTPLFDTYCVRCHSSTLTGAARNGAPAFHDFDTRQGVDNVLLHIDKQAGSGPAATNTLMPPDSPTPSKAQREMLAQFVACECQIVTCTNPD